MEKIRVTNGLKHLMNLLIIKILGEKKKLIAIPYYQDQDHIKISGMVSSMDKSSGSLETGTGRFRVLKVLEKNSSKHEGPVLENKCKRTFMERKNLRAGNK